MDLPNIKKLKERIKETHIDDFNCVLNWFPSKYNLKKQTNKQRNKQKP